MVQIFTNGVPRVVSGFHNLAMPSQNIWSSFQVDIGQQAAGFNIELSGTSTTRLGLFEDIALDNIQLVDCDPHLAPVTPKPGSEGAFIACDFESDLCGWQVIGVSVRSNWLRTTDGGKEPGIDHTSLQKPKPAKSGTWLTTQSAVGGGLQADTDYLSTVMPLKAGKTYCLSFNYYFIGIDLGSSLALYASKSSKASANPASDADYTALWFTDLPLTRNWNFRQVEIGSQSADFYLIFVAKVDATAIIGLDDIAFAEGNCLVLDPGYCDFEVNNCDWKAGAGNGWQRSSDPKIRDHTTGTVQGHVMQDITQNQTVSMIKTLDTMPIFNQTTSSNSNNDDIRVR